jgi:hypothetical protein
MATLDAIHAEARSYVAGDMANRLHRAFDGLGLEAELFLQRNPFFRRGCLRLLGVPDRASLVSTRRAYSAGFF